MNSQTVVYCVVALMLGMLLSNMLKNVCGCKTVEGAAPLLGPGTQGLATLLFGLTDSSPNKENTRSMQKNYILN